MTWIIQRLVDRQVKRKLQRLKHPSVMSSGTETQFKFNLVIGHTKLVRRNFYSRRPLVPLKALSVLFDDPVR